MSGNDAENDSVDVKDLYRTVAREDPEWFENYVLDVLMDDICDKNDDDDDSSFMMELVELAKQSKLEKRKQQQQQQQKAAESKKESQQQQQQQQVIPTQSTLSTEKLQNDIQSNEEIVADVMQSVETSPTQDNQATPPTAPPDLTAQHQEETNNAKKSLTAETQGQNTSTIGETLVKSDTGLEENISIADNASVVLDIADQSNGQLKPYESSPIESTVELVQQENVVEYKDDQNKANSAKEHVTDHTWEHDTTSQQSTPRLADSSIPENMNEPKTVEPPKVVEEGLDRTVATTSVVAEKTVPSQTADKVVEKKDDGSYVVLYRGAYHGAWKQVNLTTLIALGYSREDILPLEMDALDLIVREKIKRPRTGVPSRWKTAPTSSSVGASERKRGDVIRIVQRSEAEELRLVRTDREEDDESRSTRSTSRSDGPTGQKRSSEHIQVTADDPPIRREPRNKAVKDITMPEADRLRGDRVAPVEDVRRRPVDKNRDTVRERKGQDPDDGEIPNRKPKAETGVAERSSPEVRVRDRKGNDSVATADRQRDPLPKKNADDDDVLGGRDRLDSQEGRTRRKPNDERERVPREKRRERAPLEDKERRVYSVWQEPQKKKQTIKDPPPPNSKFWPDIDTFRSLLRNEAGLRLRILGDDWKDVVKEESDWRLNLYKEWLWTLHHGVGEPFVESRSDRMRRQGSKRPEAPAPRKQKSRNE